VIEYSQSFVEPHFTGQWFRDPVNKCLWLVSVTRLATSHFQLQHDTGLILKYDRQHVAVKKFHKNMAKQLKLFSHRHEQTKMMALYDGKDRMILAGFKTSDVIRLVTIPTCVTQTDGWMDGL